MIKTLSLCPVCYKKIEADISIVDNEVKMMKVCNSHGEFISTVEKDITHFSNFYELGTIGINKTIIIHIHNQCNMKCPWCYYPMGEEKMHPFDFYHRVLMQYKFMGFNLLFSGGEPTIRPDFFEFTDEAYKLGWNPSSITNMISLADKGFFARTMNQQFVTGNIYRFAMSFQHPKNYSPQIYSLKLKAIENIAKAGLKAMCCMFSITSLDELDFIRDFYNQTKGYYSMLRIRTMFRNWANKDDKNHIYLSDLHKAFMDKFSDLLPIQCRSIEHSNIYCLYMKMDDGMDVSLSSAPTVENVDYHMVSRPVYMLAQDYRCYPVPLAQIINEGISKGWKDGLKIQGGEICG